MSNQRDIDKIIDLTREAVPNMRFVQLGVTHHSDDDGIWYFWMPGARRDEIQIENSAGECPFLIETTRNDDRRIAETIEETVLALAEHLKTSSNENIPLAICLMSGGMDSCVTAAIARTEFQSVAFLHISYGQITEERERTAYEQIASYYHVSEKLDISIEHLARMGGSSLTDESISVTEADLESKDIPTSYVPFRNANMLSIATSWAEVIGATAIYIGAVAEDSSGYPDCRPEFYVAFQQTITTGTKPDTHIEVRTPIINLTKAEIVKKGIELEAPLDLTWSCYRNEDLACGTCDSCALRLRGFATAGIIDPVTYLAS